MKWNSKKVFFALALTSLVAWLLLGPNWASNDPNQLIDWPNPLLALAIISGMIGLMLANIEAEARLKREQARNRSVVTALETLNSDRIFKMRKSMRW